MNTKLTISNTDKQHRILYNCHKDRRKTPALSEELRAATFEAERKRVLRAII